MAARPNALRTLAYGKRLAENQLERLREMITVTDNTLKTNKTLTADDVAGYRACIVLAKNQIKKFADIAGVDLPSVDLSTKRGRGRPSEEELHTLAAARQLTIPGSEIAAPQKRRGRPPKNPAPPIQATVQPAISTPEAQPVKRGPGRPRKNPIVEQPAAPQAVVAVKRGPGRPRKNPVEETQVVEVQAPEAQLPNAPKRRGRPPKNREAISQPVAQQVAPVAPVKRRGRPPKNAAVEVPVVEQAQAPKRRGRPPKNPQTQAAPVAQTVAPEQPVKRGPGRPRKNPLPEAQINAAPISDAAPVKRGPGRPKGSKNKPKIINGQNDAVLQPTG